MIDRSSLKFGIVGYGRVVRELHQPAWRNIKTARLMSVCDASEDAVRAATVAFPGVRGFADFEEFLSHSEHLDFVDIATPGPTHFELVKMALDRRINVLCEKPLAIRGYEVKELYDLAEQAHLTLTCVHNYRFKDNSQSALRLLKRGSLGDIVSVAVRFRASPLLSEQPAWLRRERESRTVLFDSGIHLVDLALRFLGPVQELRFVDSDVDYVGIQRVVFGTAHTNGSRGLFDFMIDAASASTEIEIQGESRALALHFFPEGMRVLPARDSPIHRAIGEVRRVCSYMRGAASERLLGKSSRRALSHERLFQEFVGSLRSDNPNPIPSGEVLETIGLLDEVAERAYGLVKPAPKLNGEVRIASLGLH
jgi:predicted dehydrogenase